MADRKAKLFVRFTIALAVASLIVLLLPPTPLAYATTVTYQVAQPSDDSYKFWNDTAWTFSTSAIDIRAGVRFPVSIYKQGGGYRFQNIAVPNGAVITSAYMQYYLGTGLGMDFTQGVCNNKIRGEAADNASTFTDLTDFDARTRTTATVTWSGIEGWYQGNWYNSPDITSIIQEIVNRAGWASGNSIVIFRDDFDNLSTNVFYCERPNDAYERGAAAAAKLVITYTTSSSGLVPNTPSVDTAGIGLNATFTCRWSTNGTLDKYIFSWNFTGSWANETAAAFSTLNSTVTLSLGSNISRVGEVVGWRFYANTTAGIANSTEIQNMTLTLPSTSFVIYGPYYETGEVAPVELNVTLHYTNGAIQVYLLNGTDGNATTYLFEPAYTPSYISWPISGLNYTRIYDLTGLTTAEVNIYLPSPDSTPLIYQFTISDYSGMTNPYLSTTKTINGTTQQIERKAITVGTVSFLMEQWTTYGMAFSCDQGSYTNPFSAENSYYTNLNVAPLMFTQETIGSGYSCMVKAYNTMGIRVTYTDTDNLTTSINILIIEGDGDNELIKYNTTITGFNETYPGGVYVFDWTDRDNTLNYQVIVLAMREGVLHSWAFPILKDASSPFTGVFDFLGTWPNDVDPAQVIGGVVVILSGIGIFSYFGTAMGCGFSWVMAGIMAAVGWYTLSIPMFVFAGLITFLIYIDEAKKTAREI